jgi:hypothetical protein
VAATTYSVAASPTAGSGFTTSGKTITSPSVTTHAVGNIFIVFVDDEPTSNTVTSVVDSGTGVFGTFQAAVPYTAQTTMSGTKWGQVMYWAPVLAVGTGKFVINFASTANSSNTDVDYVEWSSSLGSNAQWAVAAETFNNPATASSTPTFPSLATTGLPSGVSSGLYLAFMFCQNSASTPSSPTSGFTYSALSYNLYAANPTYTSGTAAGKQSSSGNYATSAALFYATPATPSAVTGVTYSTTPNTGGATATVSGTTASFAMGPIVDNDVVMLAVESEPTGRTLSTVTSPNITWTQVVANTTLSTTLGYQLWMGVVNNSATTETVTLSYGGTGTLSSAVAFWQEFSTNLQNPSWYLITSGQSQSTSTTNTTISVPSGGLASSGNSAAAPDLYWGFVDTGQSTGADITSGTAGISVLDGGTNALAYGAVYGTVTPQVVCAVSPGVYLAEAAIVRAVGTLPPPATLLPLQLGQALGRASLF